MRRGKTRWLVWENHEGNKVQTGVKIRKIKNELGASFDEGLERGRRSGVRVTRRETHATRRSPPTNKNAPYCITSSAFFFGVNAVILTFRRRSARDAARLQPLVVVVVRVQTTQR